MTDYFVPSSISLSLSDFIISRVLLVDYYCLKEIPIPQSVSLASTVRCRAALSKLATGLLGIMTVPAALITVQLTTAAENHAVVKEVVALILNGNAQSLCQPV